MLSKICSVPLLLALAAAPLSAAGLDVEARFERPVETEGSWTFRAIVRDLSGEVLSAPTVKLQAGQDAEVFSQVADDDVLQVSVRVAADGREASYGVRRTLAGEVVDSQASTVRF